MCTYRDCDSPTNTYPSLLAAQTHELSLHPSSGQNPADNERVCPFCDDQPTPGASACRHIGRHMEEIAFSVVSIPYEDWSFYSDSSLVGSSKDLSISWEDEALSACEHQSQSTHAVSSHGSDSTRHQAPIHSQFKQEVQWPQGTSEKIYGRPDPSISHSCDLHPQIHFVSQTKRNLGT